MWILNIVSSLVDCNLTSVHHYFVISLFSMSSGVGSACKHWTVKISNPNTQWIILKPCNLSWSICFKYGHFLQTILRSFIASWLIPWEFSWTIWVRKSLYFWFSCLFTSISRFTTIKEDQIRRAVGRERG